MRARSSLATVCLLLAACGGEERHAPHGTGDPSLDHEPFFPIAAGFHQGLSCASCHPVAADAKQFTCIDCHKHAPDATAAVHAAVDGYAYESGKCLGCHPRGDASTVRPADHELRFPIAAGTAHGTVPCASCHTDPAHREVVSCSSGSCHPAADLAPRHTRVSDFAADGARCVRCHADAQVNRVADHAAFALAAPAPHHAGEARSGACLTCHPQVRADKPYGADFARTTCLACHEGDRAFHAGIPDATFDDASCLGCHPGGGKDLSFVHASFPIGAGSAHDGKAACTDCHAPGADRKDVTCASSACHPAAATTAAHVHVGGFDMASPMCERCHPDGQVDRMADHLPLAIVAGAPHFEGACLSCHPQVLADRPFGADFAVQDCLSCHEHEKTSTDALHAGIPFYGYESRLCLECHPDGTRDASFQHPLFPIAAGTKHAAAACADCHADPTDHANVTCSSGACHPAAEVTPAHADVGGFDGRSASCEACHAEGQVFRLAQHGPFSLAAASAHFRAACRTCHPQMRTDDRPFGTDFRVSTCVDASCHPQAATATAHGGVSGYVYASASCRDCHPTGAAADAVDHGQKYPIGPGSSHADVTCAQCHTDAADRKIVTCAGSCHGQTDMSTAHSGKVGGYRYDGALCLKCHSDTPAFRVAKHLPFRITATGRHSACLTCHPTLRTDRPFAAADFTVYDCLGSGCHDDRTELATRHSGRAGYAYASTTCTKSGCHPTGGGN
jgi:hypothetical protein